MSVQFGRWSFDGLPPEPAYLDAVSELLAPHGPDGGSFFSSKGLDILYRALHTRKESRRERQPYVSPSGFVVVWDGRLDNREGLARQLGHEQSGDAPDVSIVASAYKRWGDDCLVKLSGDWAVSIWNPNERSLLLAKDPIGVRPLYYSTQKQLVLWSSILEPLVLLAGKSFELAEEYIAGWFSFFPAAHLTPYAGVHSVGPSTCVRFTEKAKSVKKYWDFDPGKRIRYRADGEYEEHFRCVFTEAVRRRLCADAPILAELSGGMDSSSIVCMADAIISDGHAETPRLDTVSYYNDQEPNWNERPFFVKVEEKRGRTGSHIDVSSEDSFLTEFDNNRPAMTPASGSHKASKQLSQCMLAGGHRVVLSGIGGDEVTGGVPTPIPELADLLAGGRFISLAHQLKVWALYKRKPWFHLFFEAAQGFLPPSLLGVPKRMRPAVWLDRSFVKRHRAALTGYSRRLRLFGDLPSFQENLRSLDGLRRQLGCTALPSTPPCERRYPYLDRDLLEFLFAIPQEQLVRPGHRRSLMRRSLGTLVPAEILNRRRKAFLARSPLLGISREWQTMLELTQAHLSGPIRIVDCSQWVNSWNQARRSSSFASIQFARVFSLVRWLEYLKKRRVPGVPREGFFLQGHERSLSEFPEFSTENILRERG